VSPAAIRATSFSDFNNLPIRGGWFVFFQESLKTAGRWFVLAINQKGRSFYPDATLFFLNITALSLDRWGWRLVADSRWMHKKINIYEAKIF
jgi:hypothetical protein